MKIPVTYNFRSMLGRPVSTALTALGIGLVVAVFVGMLALANGFAAALTRTGSAETVLVLRRAADSELSSSIDRASASIISAAPHIGRGTDGRQLVSAESYIVVPLGRIEDTTKLANVVVRGVSDQAWTVRANVAVTDGVRPAAGQNEICVGNKLLGRFPGTAIGETMRFAAQTWKVTCHFAAGGSAFESEVWGPSERIMPAMRRDAFQSLSFKLADPASVDEATEARTWGVRAGALA